MHLAFTELQRLFARWHAEHAQVAQCANALNLKRVRTLGMVVLALNGFHVLLFAVQLLSNTYTDIVFKWKISLLLAHLGMGLTMGLGTWAAHRLRYTANGLAEKGLPVAMLGLALLFTIGITAIDQWVTPNMTPFLISAMAIGLVSYLRPSTTAKLFLAAYVAFFYAIGLTQLNPELLLSNRLNGLTASVMAWALSALLWRKFTTITLQQAQLEKANIELQNKHKELQRLTRLDGLTGLYNRSTFVELSRQELARAQRQGSATTILLLDLDFFKRVNDTWGHPAGDAVLKNVAAVANNSVRATDLVGRLGGEEFIILLPNTSLEAARRLAEKLRANVQGSPTPWQGAHIDTTVSIGLASTTSAQGHDFDHLYTEADKALYVAKDKGRNRVI